MKTGESKKAQIVGIIVGIIVFALTFYGVQQLFKDNLESELKEVALELNKQTPMQIDQFTRLDSASSMGKTNLIYYYTLIDLEKSEVNLDTAGINDNVTHNPDLQIYRDNIRL